MNDLEVYLIILLKLTIGFSIIVLYINFINRNQLSQSSSIDLIGNFVLGAIIGGSIYLDDLAITKYIGIMLVAIVFLGCLNFVSRRVKFLRKPILGKPIPLIKNGHFLVENFRTNKSQFDIIDVTSLLRMQKIFSLHDIKFAQLENNGNLTVVKEHEDNISTLVLKEGLILKEEVKKIGKNVSQLLVELGQLKIINIAEVFAAEWSSKGLFVVMNDGTVKHNFKDN